MSVRVSHAAHWFPTAPVPSTADLLRGILMLGVMKALKRAKPAQEFPSSPPAVWERRRLGQFGYARTPIQEDLLGVSTS
jgi:hypothetical protein